jgi:hypothetical protein
MVLENTKNTKASGKTIKMLFIAFLTVMFSAFNDMILALKAVGAKAIGYDNQAAQYFSRMNSYSPMLAQIVYTEKETIIETIPGGKALKPLLADESANVVALVGSMIVTIFFVALLLVKISPLIVGTDSDTNATITTVKSTAWSYLILLTIIPLAVIFGAAMAYLGRTGD